MRSVVLPFLLPDLLNWFLLFVSSHFTNLHVAKYPGWLPHPVKKTFFFVFFFNICLSYVAAADAVIFIIIIIIMITCRFI